MPVIAVDADFHADVRAYLLAELDAAGFDVPADVVPHVEKVTLFYFNIRWKLLPARPRAVHRSRELRGRAVPPAIADVVDFIEARAAAGDSIRQFLSDRLTRMPEYDDPLLNEWGIYHLHLGGTMPQPNAYAPRSSELLFVYAQESDLYFLDVRDHRAFLDDGLVEILHANWPDVISRYRAVGFTRGHENDKVTPEMRRMARKRGLTIVTEVSDGTLYLPPGGGYMCSGLSGDVLTRSDRFLDYTKRLEDNCRARADELARVAGQARTAPLSAMHLNLRLDGGPGRMSVIETQTRHVFPVSE